MTIDTKSARSLVEAATPGPWVPNVWIDSNSNGWRATGPHCEDENSSDSEPGCPAEQAAQRDAAFIAASRTLVPALLDEVERLRRLVAMYEQPRLAPLDWTNCRHNRAIDPDTGECLDCGTVLP